MGVFNHVDAGFPVLAQVIADGPSSAHPDWFVHDRHQDEAEPGFATFEDRGLVTLNHANPAVVDVMVH